MEIFFSPGMSDRFDGREEGQKIFLSFSPATDTPRNRFKTRGKRIRALLSIPRRWMHSDRLSRAC